MCVSDFCSGLEILESFNKKFQFSVLESQLHNRGFDNFHAPKLDGINRLFVPNSKSIFQTQSIYKSTQNITIKRVSHHNTCLN